MVGQITRLLPKREPLAGLVHLLAVIDRARGSAAVVPHLEIENGDRRNDDQRDEPMTVFVQEVIHGSVDRLRSCKRIKFEVRNAKFE